MMNAVPLAAFSRRVTLSKIPPGLAGMVPLSLLSHIFSATAASEGLGNPVARAS